LTSSAGSPAASPILCRKLGIPTQPRTWKRSKKTSVDYSCFLWWWWSVFTTVSSVLDSVNVNLFLFMPPK
jgi:hypothetical protein